MVTIAKERRPLFVPNESSKAVISSSVDISGSVVVTGGITGSIKNTVAGNPFIAAGANITTTYNSLGQWVITGTGEGGGGGGNGGSSTITVDVADTDAVVTNETIVNVIGLTQSRTITLPTNVSSGTLIIISNGDGSATDSKYVKVVASSNDLIDGVNRPHFAVIKPYDFTQYIYQNNNWNIVASKIAKLEESWIHYAAIAGLTITSESTHDGAIGIQFTCLSKSILQGFRLKLDISSNVSKDFDIKVWTNGSAIATKTISTTGPIDQQIMFDNPVVLEKGKTYFLTYKDKTGVNYYYLYIGSPIYVYFGYATRMPPIIVNAPYCYSYGDTQPSNYLNQVVGVLAPIEPIIFA